MMMGGGIGGYMPMSRLPFKHIFAASTTILYSKTPFSPGYNCLHRRPWLLAITAIPAIFQIATLPFCPESPKYLLLDKDDEHGAEEGLKDFDFRFYVLMLFSPAVAEGDD